MTHIARRVRLTAARRRGAGRDRAAPLVSESAGHTRAAAMTVTVTAAAGGDGDGGGASGSHGWSHGGGNLFDTCGPAEQAAGRRVVFIVIALDGARLG